VADMIVQLHSVRVTAGETCEMIAYVD